MSGDEDTDCSMSERGSVDDIDEEEEEDEEEDVSILSSLDNYQICLRYQQVLYIQLIQKILSNIRPVLNEMEHCIRKISLHYVCFSILSVFIAPVQTTKQRSAASTH